MNMLDRLIIGFDGFLRTINRVKSPSQVLNPCAGEVDDAMTDADIEISSKLMRVNHAGEVCAQGLYKGQAIFASNEITRKALQHAAEEEEDHLAWCRERLDELNADVSLLDPLWYTASFALGASVALISDRVSLGFVHATEENVAKHLVQHLARLPATDLRSRQILETMLEDERRHGQAAIEHGGVELPSIIRRAMWEGAKIVTRTAERI